MKKNETNHHVRSRPITQKNSRSEMGALLGPCSAGKTEEMKIFEEVLKISIDAVPYIPGHDDGSYKEGFIDGLEHAQELLDIHKGRAIIDIITDVLNWLNQNPLEWEYGGDVDDIIDKYIKSKRI